MKNYLRTLSPCIALAIFLISFNSCTKENVNPVKDQTENEISVRAINTPPAYAVSITGFFKIWWYTGGCHTAGGTCVSPDWMLSPTAEPVLEEGQAAGVAYANEEEKLVLNFDGSTLGAAFWDDIHDDYIFQVGYEFILPEDLVNEAYAASGQTAPSEPFVIHAGEYLVTYDDTQSQATFLLSDGSIIIAIDDVY